MQYFSYAVSGATPVPDTIRIYGYNVPENILGQPTEYLAAGLGVVTYFLLKGGLGIVGGLAGVGAAAAVYAARNNLLPGNSGGGLIVASNIAYAYNYTQDRGGYYSPQYNF